MSAHRSTVCSNACSCQRRWKYQSSIFWPCVIDCSQKWPIIRMTSKCGMMLNRWKEILLMTNYWYKQCWTKHPEKFDFMDNITKRHFLKYNNCFQIIFILLLRGRTFKVVCILPQYNSQYSIDIVHTVINIMLMGQNLDTIYLEYGKQCFHQ